MIGIARVWFFCSLILWGSIAVTAQEAMESLSQEASTIIPTPPSIPDGCERKEHTLLLDSQTVLRNVRWRIKRGNPDGSDRVGCGFAVPHRQSTGHFWFFGPDNIELTCKALNGAALTGAYWVFCAALTDVEWWVDAINNGNSDIRKQYYGAPGNMASFGDVAALAVGRNTAPVIVDPGGDCGKTYVFPRQTSLTVSFLVKDADLDNLTAAPKGLKGEVVILPPEWNGEPLPPNGLKLYPRWKGVVSGSGATLVVSIYLPGQPGDFTIGLEVTDGKTLVPVLCPIGFLVL